MIFTLMFTMAAPIFAWVPSSRPQAEQDALKAQLAEIVHRNMGAVSSIENYLVGLVDEDYIKGLIENYLRENLDLSTLGGLSGFAGPVIANLAKGFLGTQGVTLPDSIDLEGMIDGVLGSEFVNQILENELVQEFIARVITRTIQKVLAQISVSQIVGDLTDEMLAEAEAKLVETIWNNGNPDATPLIGAWINGTNPTCIGSFCFGGSESKWASDTVIAGRMALLVATNFNYYVNTGALTNFDITKIVSTDMILNALWESFLEVGQEFLRELAIGKLNDYFGLDIALDADNETIKAALIDMLKDKARAAVIGQLNDCLGLNIALNATDEEILCAFVNMFKDKARAAFICELNRIFANLQLAVDAAYADIAAAIAQLRAINFCDDIAPIAVKKLECLQFIARLFCLHEISDCIDNLLACINNRCSGFSERELTGSYITYIKVAGNAAIARIDVTVTDEYSDGTSDSYTGIYQGAYTVGQVIEVTTTGTHSVYVKMKKFPAAYNAGDYWLD